MGPPIPVSKICTEMIGSFPGIDIMELEHAVMEPHGQSPWSLLKYPPAPMDAETLQFTNAKASEGYPPVAESAGALTQEHRIDLATESAFIHGQSPWSSA
jgi:hypothetical protein